MSEPRIKFRDEVFYDDTSVEDEEIVVSHNIDKGHSNRRSDSFHYIKDLSLKERRKNLENRIKIHCRNFNQNARSLSSERKIEYPRYVLIKIVQVK